MLLFILLRTLILPLGLAFCSETEVLDRDLQELLNGRSPASVALPEHIRRTYSEAQRLKADGRYLAAAAAYFNVYTEDSPLSPLAGARLTESLVAAHLPNNASYFFIKILETANKQAIRVVLHTLPTLMDSVGGDLLRPYVLRATSESDYSDVSRDRFFYFLGKDHLLKGEPEKALGALGRVSSRSDIYGQALYLRGTALASLGHISESIAAFESCKDASSRRSRGFSSEERQDLSSRCSAGLARAYYEDGRFEKAEETYDEIPKSSFVWADILFEQAWNAYAKKDYNRALGKLVTYRSPSLMFVFNPEVDVLRAQSFFSLCIYEDVEKTVKEFEDRYHDVGLKMKNFLVQNDKDLFSFWKIARQAYSKRLHTHDELSRALNRFIRGPYFADLVNQERQIAREQEYMRQQASLERLNADGLPGFLTKVLQWRIKTVRLLGGLFVKNSLYDLYQDLLTNLDKMSFIKLEMLKRAKGKLERKSVMSADEDGNLKKGADSLDRKDHQYLWTFNGEFWLDELGDYVFALESECGS